jgi:D-beta-D-heptose 7-phosphate kinase/D-beta-D-heptose 1-phosphate adenosyltransferase
MDNIVLLIGESCTDIFIYGDTPRLSPEGPAPVFLPKREVYNGGMVLNVENNLKMLNIESDVITQTTHITKTRYVNDTFNTLLLRVDENDLVDHIDDTTLHKNLWEYSMIVISDYNKGFLHEEDIAYIAFKHPNVICDTKKKLGDWCKDLKFIKLNRTEYQNNLEYIKSNDWILEKLIITLDKDGCMYMDKMYPTEQVEIMDISGAGDTFVAGFVKKYLDTNDISESIIFGNKCSAQVVQKRGVGTVEFENLK